MRRFFGKMCSIQLVSVSDFSNFRSITSSTHSFPAIFQFQEHTEKIYIFSSILLFIKAKTLIRKPCVLNGRKKRVHILICFFPSIDASDKAKPRHLLITTFE